MKVDIYIETSSIYQGITDRKCSYVLSVSIRNEERTKEGFGHLEGTWHQAVLVTLAEALERMTVPCEICIHTRDVCGKQCSDGCSGGCGGCTGGCSNGCTHTCGAGCTTSIKA